MVISMPMSRLLRFPALVAFVMLGTTLPAGCGDTDEGGSPETGGSAAGTGGKAGAASKGGAGGSIASPNAALCDQQTPTASQPCSVPGIVCPTARGNCACTAGAWKCYEVGAGGAAGANTSGAGGKAGAGGAGVAGSAGGVGSAGKGGTAGSGGSAGNAGSSGGGGSAGISGNSGNAGARPSQKTP